MALFDHLTELKWLFQQHIGKLMPRAWLEIFYTGLNKVEEVIDDHKQNDNILDGTGWILDEILKIIDFKRGGLSDDAYRGAGIVRARALFPDHTVDEFLELMRLLMGPGRSLAHQYAGPAAFIIYAEDLTVEESKLFGDSLAPLPIAGVGANIVTWDSSATLNYSSIHGPVTVTGGWSSIHGDPGSTTAGYAHAIALNP